MKKGWIVKLKHTQTLGILNKYLGSKMWKVEIEGGFIMMPEDGMEVVKRG